MDGRRSVRGMDLERVLVLNPDEEANAGQLCALLLEGATSRLDLPQPAAESNGRTLAACPPLGHLVTLRMWPGLHATQQVREAWLVV